MTTQPTQADTAYPNGSRVVRGPHPFYSLQKIEQCPVYLGAYGRLVGRRTVQITGEPDTVFSAPARASIAGRKVPGFVTTDSGANEDRPEGFVFIVSPDWHEWIRLHTEPYNGHRDWAHWNVALWIWNEHAMAKGAEAIIRDAATLSEATDRILRLCIYVWGPKTPDGAEITFARVREAIREDFETREAH
jgi:hypothetical protein